MKIPRGTVIYFESKKRPMCFRGYKILSHHPEFNAATCVPVRLNGKPIIISMEGHLFAEQVEKLRTEFQKQKDLENYGPFLALVKQHGTDIRKLAPHTGLFWSYPATYQKLQACKRRGLL